MKGNEDMKKPIFDRVLSMRNKDERFINGDLSMAYESKLESVEDAVELISEHMSKNHKIMIYGDYDSDGATASAVCHKAFNMLNYDNIVVKINERLLGNGINQNTVDTLKASPDVKLVITVDHGVANEFYINAIRELGIDVIVTDHHTLRKGELPVSANVVVNPQKESVDTFKYISGCAVAYFVMYELLHHHNIKIEQSNELLDLVGISIIGDMMDMRDPINRALVKEGMRILNTDSMLGKVLCRKLKKDKLVSKDISFSVVPMLNASSRVSYSRISYMSLMANTVAECEMAVDELYDINHKRKLSQRKLVEVEVMPQVDNTKNSNIIVVSKKAVGLNGIISSVVGYGNNKPTITFIHGDERMSGSCRGIVDTLDVKECLDWIDTTDDSIMARDNGEAIYGGHSGAAGLTINTDKFDKFSLLFREYIATNDIKYTISKEDIIASTISLNEYGTKAEQLSKLIDLEPYGNHWKSPLISIEFDKIKNISTFNISTTTKIIKFTGSTDNVQIPITMFKPIEYEFTPRGAIMVGTISHVKDGFTMDVEHIIN